MQSLNVYSGTVTVRLRYFSGNLDPFKGTVPRSKRTKMNKRNRDEDKLHMIAHTDACLSAQHHIHASRQRLSRKHVREWVTKSLRLMRANEIGRLNTLRTESQDIYDKIRVVRHWMLSLHLTASQRVVTKRVILTCYFWVSRNLGPSSCRYMTSLRLSYSPSPFRIYWVTAATWDSRWLCLYVLRLSSSRMLRQFWRLGKVLMRGRNVQTQRLQSQRSCQDVVLSQNGVFRQINNRNILRPLTGWSCATGPQPAGDCHDQDCHGKVPLRADQYGLRLCLYMLYTSDLHCIQSGDFCGSILLPFCTSMHVENRRINRRSWLPVNDQPKGMISAFTLEYYTGRSKWSKRHLCLDCWRDFMCTVLCWNSCMLDLMHNVTIVLSSHLLLSLNIFGILYFALQPCRPMITGIKAIIFSHAYIQGLAGSAY